MDQMFGAGEATGLMVLMCPSDDHPPLSIDISFVTCVQRVKSTDESETN